VLARLLVPLDRSAVAEQAIGHAVAIARACHAALDLVIVSEPEALSILSDDAAAVEAKVRTDTLYVRELAHEVSATECIPTTHAVLRGEVVAGIAARARAIGADLIIMTSHGRTGLSRAWLGSVADGVIRSAPAQVLMLRPTKERAMPAPCGLYRRILVPLDGSPEAREILRPAATLAQCTNARIVLVRVVRPAPMITSDASLALLYPLLLRDEVATTSLVDKAREELAELARQLAARGIDVEHDVVVAEHVAVAVLDFARARGADLIAMSTTGRGTSRLVIGSLADKIVRGTELPVLFSTPAHAVARTLIDAVRDEELSPASPS